MGVGPPPPELEFLSWGEPSVSVLLIRAIIADLVQEAGRWWGLCTRSGEVVTLFTPVCPANLEA